MGIKANKMSNKKNIWCSIHQPTPEQLKELGNVVLLQDLNPELQGKLNNTPSTKKELFSLAVELLVFCGDYDNIVQPGGSPAFQYHLGIAASEQVPACDGGFIFKYDVLVRYSHSARVSEDIPQADGSVKKVSIFKHLGWI